jgi:DNA-binding LytR/AlgR family response regulator
MNVLVCDDDRQVVDSVIESLKHQIEETNTASKFYGFSQPSQVNLSLPYDIALLDIDMGEINGIDFARKLRAENGNIVIIFITNFIQYAPEGFEVQAFRYLLKPISSLSFLLTLIQPSKRYFDGNSLSQFQ